MTEEEIKALKPGDKITIEYTVEAIKDAVVDVLDREGGRTGLFKSSKGVIGIADLVHPAPKLEKGDRVRIIPDPLTGYAYSDSFVLNRYIGLEGIVAEECDYHGQLEVDMGDAAENGNILINIHCLVLTKKHAKEKYYVCEGVDGKCVCFDKDKQQKVVATINGSILPNAAEHAKKICDRLNAEWRDEQLIKINDHEF